MSLYGTEVVESHWPMDGPHGPELIESAAVALAELVRYLNRATLPSAQVLGEAPHGAGLLGSLATAAQRERQLCQQLEAWAHQLAADPSLQHDRCGDDAALSRQMAVTAAEEAEGELGFAVEFAEELARCLDGARRRVEWLSHAGGDRP